MSRTSGDRKSVGFGTHITAGGLAGAMEAVCRLRALKIILSKNKHLTTAMLPTIGHYQSTHAAL